MTDDQMKFLAEMTLLNDERIHVFSSTLHKLIEQQADAGKFGENANSLRHSVEQAEALSRDADILRAKLRKAWGLD